MTLATLIVLSKLGDVDFLQRIFERIYIPISVEQEIFKKEDDVKKAVKVLIEQGLNGIIKEEPDEIYRMLRSADFWISRDLFQSLFEE